MGDFVGSSESDPSRPFHLWGPRLYFCCSSSLSNSYCWDSLLCQISLLGRFPSKNETRLTLLIHVLFNHSWKEEKLFVRCNIDPLIFPKAGSGNSSSCPSITRTHSTCLNFFCWSPFIIVEFEITSFHPCLLFLSWENPQKPLSKLDPLQRFPSFKIAFSLSVSRIPDFYFVYASVETEVQRVSF